jgi:SIR2-like protein
LPTQHFKSDKFPKPRVFIFGAGATRGGLKSQKIPPPIDTDFFSTARQITGHGTQTLARKVLKSVWELYGKTQGIGLEYYYRDIETRANIGAFAKTANQPKNWTQNRKELEELIRRVFIQTSCGPGNPFKPIPSSDHAGILQRVEDKDTLITFNYDLLIEESFPENMKLWSPINGYGLKVGGITLDWCRKWLEKRHIRNNQESKIVLLKLHGSLNWTLNQNGTIKIKPRPYVVRTRNNKILSEKILILPPAWKKAVNKYPYKHFWKQARLKLEKCRTLVILGYSLPETDLLAHALLAEVIRLRSTRNKCLKALHLIDPNLEVREKFMDMFSPALGAYGKIYQYEYLDNFVHSISS